jgi:dephospho-CoA kinase
MKIIVIVGMPASGKNIARLYAEERGIPHFATGDLVRREAARRGLEADAETIARISTELRGRDGMGVTRLALAAALRAAKPVVFLEGMRSWPEIELIRKEAEVKVVAFLAPRNTRLQRILSRGRSDDSPAHFHDRDLREITYGAAVPIALADEYILNTGSVEEGISGLDSLIRQDLRS